MADADIEEVATPAAVAAAYPVMCQLFEDLDRDEFDAFFDDDRYRLFALWEDGDVVGLAGLSVRPVMHHERHVWLHDLVVDEARRGQGYGSRLLSFVESWAAEAGCDLVALATSPGREAAQGLYDDRGYDRWGYVYERRL